MNLPRTAALLAFWLLPLPALCAPAITVRALSVVGGAQFTLGDIAAIQGAPPALAAKLRAAVIGVSPLPGLTRQLLPGDVVMHLRADHVYNAHWRLTLPPLIQVERKAVMVTAAQLAAAAMTAAQGAIKSLPDAKLQPVPALGSFPVAEGKLTLLPGAAGGDPVQGTLFVPVSIQVNGVSVQTVVVTLHVVRHELVVVANKVIEAHEIIGPQDVTLLDTDLPPGMANPATHLRAVIGKRTTRRIMAGMPVPADGLETPPDVLPGQVITLLCVVGSVRITASATAEQSGHVGDIIRVLTSSTSKILNARIIDSRTVLFQAAGTGAYGDHS